MSRSTTRELATEPAAERKAGFVEWVIAPVLPLLIIVSVFPGIGGRGDSSRRTASAVDPSTIVAPERFAEMRRIYAPVDFSVLAGFAYGEPTNVSPVRRNVPPAGIPGYVQALSGTKVAISGFMLPLDVDGEGVSSFLLNASFDMCYLPNQFVVVTMKDGKRTRYVHTPVVVFGVLTVSEERRDDRVVSLYQMEADNVGFSRR